MPKKSKHPESELPPGSGEDRQGAEREAGDTDGSAELLSLINRALDARLSPVLKKINGELAEGRRWREAFEARSKPDDSGREADVAPDGDETPPRGNDGADDDPHELDADTLLEIGELRGKLPEAARKRLADQLGEKASLREQLAALRGAALLLEDGAGDRASAKRTLTRSARTDAPLDRGGATRPANWKEWLAMKPEARERLLTDDTFDPRTLPPE